MPGSYRMYALLFVYCTNFATMRERKLRRSFSLVRDVYEACPETFFMEAEANNASQETELDGAK